MLLLSNICTFLFCRVIAHNINCVYFIQLEQALEVSEKDVKDASAGVLRDLRRFQKEKEEDLQRYMVRTFPLTPVPRELMSCYWSSEISLSRLLTDILFIPSDRLCPMPP